MRWHVWVLVWLVGAPALAQGNAPSVAVEEGTAEEPAAQQTVVTASRSVERLQDTPVAVEVITRKDIEATGARDLAEALGARPGLELRRSFAGTELRVQGLSPEYTLVLVDGERVTGRLGDALDFSRFSTEDIEQVEIIRGPSSVLYGSDAVAGVVNIITRKAQRPLGATAQLSLGSLWQLEVDGTAETRGERAGMRLSGGFQRRNGYDLTPGTPATTGSSLEGYQVSWRGDLRATESFRLEASAGASRRVQRGVDEGAASALFDRASQNESYEATLSPSLVLSPTGTLQFSGRYSRFRHRYVLDQRNASVLDQVEETHEQMARVGVQLDQSLAQVHQLVVGVEAIGETLDSDRLAGAGRRGRVSLYGQDSWKTPLPVALHVVPGLRLDVDSEFGTVLTPRLAVRLEPVEALTVRASYGHAFRAPSFQEQLIDFENPSVGYVVAGNPTLRPEHSRGATLSAEWRVTSRSLLWTNLFRNDLSDMISVVQDERSPTLRFTYANISRATVQGAEVGWKQRLPLGAWLDVGYTLISARDLEEDRPLEGQSTHRLTTQLGMRYRPWKLEASLQGSLVGPRPYYQAPDGTARTVMAPAYATLDARLAYGVMESVRAFVAGRNLLNAGDSQYLPIQPRAFHAGLILEL
ncbi:TonB-dependent receptor [Archangium violaceum]|nr:TonB-dependent receptor [Archangium violaceum]